ncbi:MAG: (d)CMP kinase [Pseudomonadota bacterium]|nr:(d)CMP kinase [Pseudomonadota bacterium]
MRQQGERLAVSAPPPVIAIDGPAASGKGTIALGVAGALHFHYLDSGSLYRLVALKAARAGVASDDEGRLAALAGTLDVTFASGRISLEGADVTEALRGEPMSAAASRIAVLPSVRTALLARQRAFRRPPGLVADGRDMGTVVFPDAVLKIYLTASVEVRAERRYKQLIEKGNSVTLEGLLLDIRERDVRDSARAAGPLRVAADATVLDTTDMSIEASIAFVVQRAKAVIAPYAG